MLTLHLLKQICSGLLFPLQQRTRRRLCVSGSAQALEVRCLMSATANLTAYRPVTAYIDSSLYPISEADEGSSTLGAGIRVNGDDDNANGVADYLDTASTGLADNDLVRVDVAGEGSTFVLTWAGTLAVWTSATKTAAVVNGSSVGAGQTLWVEYVSQVHTVGTSTQLQLSVNDDASTATDTVVFHSFQSVIVTIAGNTQEPSRFGDPTLGIYTIGGRLYEQGYDVQLSAHGDVLGDGKGKVYNDVVNGVLNRNVNSVALLGYSWGAGAAYNLSNALSKTKTLAPAGYRLTYTASIDGIKHRSISSETRKPVGSAYHDNVYQRKDFVPRGNNVSGAKNLNVTKTTWGKNLRHVTIDDDLTVQQMLIDSLKSRVIA